MQSAGFLLLCFSLSILLYESSNTPTDIPEVPKVTAKSCRELLKKHGKKNGLYHLLSKNNEIYQTYCDMTTDGGGWTLVASVHENNIRGQCTVGDRWTGQQGNTANYPLGDKTWANKAIFGTPVAATNDDYKNPGYFDIIAKDIAVCHVTNDHELEFWKVTSFLRYHTKSRFLKPFGGNLYNYFKVLVEFCLFQV